MNVFLLTDMCEAILHRCTEDVVRTDARTLSKTVGKISRYRDLKF